MGVELMPQGGDEQRARELEGDMAEPDVLIDEILLASHIVSTLAAAERETFEEMDLLLRAAGECARFEAATLNGLPVTFKGDTRLLRRLIRNLFENARRLGAPPVEFSVTPVAGQSVITVRDHGPGIPPR
jgi:signal transduction histidine kinase